MSYINKKEVNTKDKKIYIFIKYISKLIIDAVIIIDIIIPFLYFNFQLSIKELLGCATVFFCTFILFSVIYWPRYIKELKKCSL